MKILGISQKDSGCGFHRVVLPMAFMDGITGIVTNIPSPEMLEQKWDIVLFNRFSPFDNNFNEARNNFGAKVVMDIDDDWELPASHIVYNEYVTYKDRIENNLRNADMVTVTNQRIADKVYKFNKNVHIFKNALPFGQHQFTEDKDPSDLVRIFWCGSITHMDDIKILRGPLHNLPARGVEMVLGGYNESNERSRMIWDKMLSMYTDGKRLPFRIVRGLPVFEYMNLYKHADIMLIPLENSPWHAAKSNLKMLEAASKKIPVIVSKVEPYSLDKDAPVLWVEKQSDWIKHIKFLLNNEKERQEIGDAFYRWAVSNYNLLDINKSRAECFRGLCQA